MSYAQNVFTRQFDMLQYGIAAHELGHALGMYHEHQRPDRDEYVTIVKENVVDDDTYINNFPKVEEELVNDYGLPYDFASIMGYGAKVKKKSSIVTRTDFLFVDRKQTQPTITYVKINDTIKFRDLKNIIPDTKIVILSA